MNSRPRSFARGRARIRFLVLGAVLALLAGSAVLFAQDPLFWKRYLLAAVFSPATLPASFYEPTETVAGSNDPPPPRVDPTTEQLDPAALQAAADYAATRHSTALIVSRHGHIVFERYWNGSRFETLADLGDLQAALAALMVGIAMGDRKIGLVDEPVGNYIEELRGSERGAIPIVALLRGASGLAAAEGRSPWSEGAKESFGTDTTARCLSRSIAAPPGQRWLPQTCDVQLLALVVERATRQRYAGYISAHLWKPIGAANAHLARENPAGVSRAACCMRARQGDWMRVAELLVTDGRYQGEQVVPPGWVRQMLAPSPLNPGFGFQVWRGRPWSAEAHGAERSEPYAAADTYVLKGTGRTRLWFVPSMHLIVLRTGTNDESDTDWDDSRIPNLIVRGARDFVPPAPAVGPQDLSTIVPNH